MKREPGTEACLEEVGLVQEVTQSETWWQGDWKSGCPHHCSWGGGQGAEEYLHLAGGETEAQGSLGGPGTHPEQEGTRVC